MNHQNRMSRGFTLVEILIVVVILGILASIVLPQFSSASETARSNSTAKLLHTLRSQLQIYYAHHNNSFPIMGDMWDNMTGTTDMDGTINPDGEFGPYLRLPPVNPYTSSSTVVPIGEGTDTDGWEYDEANGAIYAVGFDEDTMSYTDP